MMSYGISSDFTILSITDRSSFNMFCPTSGCTQAGPAVIVFFLPRQSSSFFLFSDSADFFVTIQYYINSLLLQLPLYLAINRSVQRISLSNPLACHYHKMVLTNRMPFLRSKGKPSRTAFESLS